MKPYGPSLRRRQRSGSIIICALIVLLIVGMLSVQTMQTLAVIRRGSMDRVKIRQAREVAEMARKREWSVQETELTVDIPGGTEADAKQAKAIVRRTEDDSVAGRIRFTIRYPADEAGELTTTAELIKDDVQAN